MNNEAVKIEKENMAVTFHTCLRDKCHPILLQNHLQFGISKLIKVKIHNGTAVTQSKVLRHTT